MAGPTNRQDDDRTEGMATARAAAPPPNGGRSRPPGPEERRGTVATSGQSGRDGPRPSLARSLRSPRFWLTFFILTLLNWFIVPMIFPDQQERVVIPYTVFRQQVDAGNVAEITSRGDTIQGLFKNAIPEPNPPGNRQPRSVQKFETNIPTFVDKESLGRLLDERSVQISAQPLEEPRSPLLSLLFAFGPTLLLIGGFLWISSRTSSLGRMLGASRARRYEPETNKSPVTFADVAGIDEVENELVEVVDFLKNPAKYSRLGGTIPKGVLLIGAPGTGKTLLARAVAGEAGVPFFSMSGSEFIEMIVGVGASRVRQLFAQARQAAPAIVFVDELDAIGRRRGTGHFGGNDEREQTLNQLLVEMDGFDAREGVIVLAATNRADVLDPALLRPGRFDRRVTVQPPDRNGRAAILKVHTRGVPLAPDVDLDLIAGETPGLVGADLRNLVNEAALLAARKGRDLVTAEDFAEALEKIALGVERRLALSPADRERIAYHESGHALLGLLQEEGDPVRRVSIVPRGQALGVTLSVPEADRYNYGEPYLRARIVNALGGRAAEQVVYSMVTTGAEDDLRQVTELARAMVTRWGMSPEVGLLALSGVDQGNFLEDGIGGGQTRPYSEETAKAVDRATRQIVDESYAKAVNLLTTERARLDALAHALLKEESLDMKQMLEVTGLPGRATENTAAANR
jgi:cell division protease FtsH